MVRSRNGTSGLLRQILIIGHGRGHVLAVPRPLPYNPELGIRRLSPARPPETPAMHRFTFCCQCRWTARRLRIGDREGWRTHLFGRGAPGKPAFFHVTEFWVEHRLMIDGATPDIVADYKNMIRRENLDAMFAARTAA